MYTLFKALKVSRRSYKINNLNYSFALDDICFSKHHSMRKYPLRIHINNFSAKNEYDLFWLSTFFQYYSVTFEL